ncbi:NnrU family protein [Agrobacterium sp. a22-2]|uniref:NnrU family protein n=1 Tax=Agrobacterium sp. a22-2 TaxID=2283840 RepID=UPI001444E956|nr:NnrU family protein [Agrobacterium sp. a22-2]NKN35313.1 NnrU family protein [Agrobacterium sp. a22-2]
MTEFVLAFGLFLVLHSVPAVPAIRQSLIAVAGRRTYLSLYSLVSIAVLAWLFHAALNTDYIALWDPRPWQGHLTLIAAPAGLFLVLAGLFSPNPLSITLRQCGTPGAIASVTRHPVLWGFLLWSLGHLVANGDLRSLLLFGGFALFSLAGMAMLDRRARQRLGRQWQSLAENAPLLPLSAILSAGERLRVDAAMVLAATLTALLTIWLLAGGHAWLFGADPLSLLDS